MYQQEREYNSLTRTKTARVNRKCIHSEQNIELLWGTDKLRCKTSHHKEDVVQCLIFFYPFGKVSASDNWHFNCP